MSTASQPKAPPERGTRPKYMTVPRPRAATRLTGRHDRTRAGQLSRAATICVTALVGVLATGEVASGQDEAVKLGDRRIPPTRLSAALESCKQNAPEVDAARCIDRYWVPLWLLDRQAAKQKLEKSDSYQRARSNILSDALAEQIASRVPSPSGQRIEKVLQSNERDFERPRRIRLFRILLEGEEAARKLIEQLGASPSLEEFRALAREKSVDKATHQRGGDLGFVWPNGTTEIPQVRAVPTLYEAAAEVEDGKLVQEPVREGDLFAVVLRRGVLPPRSMPKERAERLVNQRLRAEAAEKKVDSMIAQLRKHHLHEVHYDMLNRFKRKENRLFQR